MPALRGPGLIRALTSALEEAGATATAVSNVDQNPRRLMVQAGQTAFELWVYVWTATHGGKPRSENEYRIQMTGVSSPLQLNPSGYTILVGYEPNLQVFAGFDLEKHLIFTPGSSSIQILLTTLQQAAQDGFSFAQKANDEIAIGVRPDQLLAYILNAQALHQQGANAAAVDLLTRVVSFQPVSSREIAQLPAERQRVISQVSRLSRDADFRRKVTGAYGQQCAVTRFQLKLIDAAHILPVGAEGSNDEVSNGLCLSPTFHRAFDQGLVYLDETLIMRINPKRERELIRLKLDGGIKDFKRYLDIQIHLPPDRDQWPSRNMIRKANEFRRIAV